MAKPRIKIIGTGGTIVSAGKSGSQLTGYSIDKAAAKQLLASVPELSNLAQIDFVAAAEIASSNITTSVWYKVAQEAQNALERDGFDGVVITHGTDTMEETAFILNLVLKTNKPVVLTGSMRPASAMSADGPLNLYSAVRVAADRSSWGKGVLIVLNSTICDARDTLKTNTLSVETFRSPMFGQLGFVVGDHVEFLRESVKPHTYSSEFNIGDLAETLPRVEIYYAHAEDSGFGIEHAAKEGVKGLVVAAAGHGTISAAAEKALRLAVDDGVAIVRASRTHSGPVLEGYERWKEMGIVPAGSLAPSKARLLLQLCLTHFGNKTEEIRRCFKTY